MAGHAAHVTMVEGGDARDPYQLTWTEQRRLLPLLPPHLARMALFDLNCGVRDGVVCNLRWDWERRIEDVGCSVFVVPPDWVKGRKGRKSARVLVCNSVAQSIIESVRGHHAEFVFVYSGRNCRKPHPVETMNNTAWQGVRQKAGLEGLHVHDLRHTVGTPAARSRCEGRDAGRDPVACERTDVAALRRGAAAGGSSRPRTDHRRAVCVQQISRVDRAGGDGDFSPHANKKRLGAVIT